jgi:hypothetical protein
MKEFGNYQNFAMDTGGGISGMTSTGVMDQPSIVASDASTNKAPRGKSYISVEEIKQAVAPEQIVRAVVPLRNIHGTQRKEEYGNMRMKRVRKAVREGGVNFLEDNPPFLCGIPDERGLTLAAIDGHHRARGSGAEGIHMVPSEVIDIGLLTEVVNRRDGTSYTTQDLVEGIQANISDAQRSFRQIPDEKQPQPILGIRTVQELSQNYATF